jgi:hypothetical protein
MVSIEKARDKSKFLARVNDAGVKIFLDAYEAEYGKQGADIEKNWDKRVYNASMGIQVGIARATRDGVVWV